MSEKKCSVLIAEDQDIVRLGLRMTLEKMPGVEVVGEAADGETVIKQTDQLHPRIILMDIGLPKVDGIEAAKQIKEKHANTAIIMFTSDASDESVFAALNAGADGYCLKTISSDQLRTAIDSVQSGAAWLDPGIASKVLRAQASPKERTDAGTTHPEAPPVFNDQQTHILQLIGQGFTLEQIAKQLSVSHVFVEAQVRAILGGSTGPTPANSQTITRARSQVMQGTSKAPQWEKIIIQPGMVLSDRFVIESKIGTGGMCTVYKGRDLTIGRTVAIKMLFEAEISDVNVKRFLQEAKAASSISHQNVITIFDFGETSDGQPYMVMDYIEGTSLEELLRKVKLDLTRTLAIAIQVCDALAAAHKKGIVHRDLKPSNIMLIKDDEDVEIVKLLDFGMAKYVLESDDMKLTQNDQLCGTPMYMSPEQFRGEKLDARSDIYSLGCVIYEMVCVNPPFTGITVYSLMNSHLNEEPSRLPFLSPAAGIPAELEAIVFQSLKKDREERPKSVLEMRAVLSKILASRQH